VRVLDRVAGPAAARGRALRRPGWGIAIALCTAVVAACGDDEPGFTPETLPLPPISETTAPSATTDDTTGSSSTPDTSATSGSDSTSSTETSTTAAPAAVGGAPAPDDASPLGDVTVGLEQIGTAPNGVAAAVRAGDDALYVAQQTGEVVRLDGGAAATVVDLSDRVTFGGERGLLGLAFSPDGSLLYVHYSDADGGDTVLSELPMSGTTADPATERIILTVDQPYPNHNGGQVIVTADGLLWLGLGDGGDGGDPHDHGQRLDTLLGKILRIDPRPLEGSPYSVPADNPFVGVEGARPEIWAYGLRNPWRFSFDRSTGDLWIGDVGQEELEEIDAVAGPGPGVNYGWNRFEGTAPFEGDAPAEHVLPVHEYTHAEGGCSVTGGFVYRGAAIPDLVGAYVFADYCAGEVMALRLRSTGAEVVPLGITVPSLSSFGETADGELVVLSIDGPVSQLTP
jgi:glucose/arabinose dehydrogenase